MALSTIILSLMAGLSIAGPQVRFGQTNVLPRSEYDNNQYTDNSVGDIERLTDAESDEEETCCCIPEADFCPTSQNLETDYQEPDLVSSGAIDVRIVNRPHTNVVRIVNKPPPACPIGSKECCQPASNVDLSQFARTGACTPKTKINQTEPLIEWRQGCEEQYLPYGPSKQCGTRDYEGPVDELEYGQASPGEFPWTCLILTEDNDFVGSCALIPKDTRNDNNLGYVKVLTAAHKLDHHQNTNNLKIRVGEYNAAGFEEPEIYPHKDYQVSRIIIHPSYNPTRLSNDIALIYTTEQIVLTDSGVNTACLPTCDNMFTGHTFVNGSGVRCWVAGWGRDEINGSFQFIQRKVDLPLVNDNQCSLALKEALNNRQSGLGDVFNLSPSEVCAGGEEGKDACVGDGGSPLVCQAKSGRWTVVGLVTWGVGCANSYVPGVYSRLSHFTSWINQN